MTKQKVDLEVNVDEMRARSKNTDGHLGPICNNCGGFGFTLTLGGPGTSAGCKSCDQTGVAAMTNSELQKMVVKMAEDLSEFKKLIIKLGKEKLSE